MLLEKDVPFEFKDESMTTFITLKKKLVEARIIIASDWNLPFEFICDARDFVGDSTWIAAEESFPSNLLCKQNLKLHHY